ncbi:DddA-like double-stranded DNA deaminase toxin [Labedaea rhizosphaerae]|uniref:Nucleic acid/nucleotide deaminase of polymorphic system toxin n=1 Tax=Labedaea rhizosphaerae TaxID=598644 RepID=A0A4R6SI15_LABRH|nr:DddA-like double-stranded DNA deaminase toxin [Labedaea rhizosphaerae]TDQ01277.1 nucleic acid/nucleotide deaminase of polymorphic system toxin [Labedaea rhizosphaerae]
MRKFLFIVALGVLAWIFVVPSCSTKFGCESAPAVANADSGDCPSDIEDAESDAVWAAARLDKIKGEKPTVGLAYDDDGTEQRYDSSKDATAKRVTEILRDLGVLPPRGTTDAANHVEMKVAADMRDGEVDGIVLVINNQNGPCPAGDPQPLTCRSLLPKVLPEDATLTVWWRPPGGKMTSTTFTGDDE